VYVADGHEFSLDLTGMSGSKVIARWYSPRDGKNIDIGTIEKHLDALQEAAPSLLATYRELGLMTIPIALAKGRIDEQRAEELKTILISLPR